MRDKTREPNEAREIKRKVANEPGIIRNKIKIKRKGFLGGPKFGRGGGRSGMRSGYF